MNNAPVCVCGMLMVESSHTLRFGLVDIDGISVPTGKYSCVRCATISNDLLIACKALIKCHQTLSDNVGEPLELAYAAIAKAEGR